MCRVYLAITDDYGNRVYVKFVPYIVGEYGEIIPVTSNCLMVMDDFGTLVPFEQKRGPVCIAGE